MKESLKEKYEQLEEIFDKLLSDYHSMREEKECLEKQNLQLEAICLAAGIKIPYKDDSEIPF